jgi:hypothetical protein
MKRFMFTLATLSLAQMPLLAQTAAVLNQSAQDAAPARHTAAIPFDQIGAVAGKGYSGEGLAVAPSRGGARLRCVFQRLTAKLTTEGLWLASTKEGAEGKPFRVIARALGRGSPQSLALSGKVETVGQVARFIRPGLTEEYSVGVDGLRQDFAIECRPAGRGSVRLELEVDGARAEAIPGGARLLLADGGRNMVYNRLKAEDARGRQLAAGLEVVSVHRLAVVLDDAAAEYPVRIDPTFSDANWVSLGGSEFWGGNGFRAPRITALAVSSNNLYAGGSFLTVPGGVSANNIAQWNGSSWSALGSGISSGVGSNSFIWALAVSGTSLYVGGQFAAAGGVSANNIAQWNGSSWSPLGSGIQGGLFLSSPGANPLYYVPQVYALAVSGTNLYVGGFFANAGEVSANNIAEWNGSSWSALGSGISGFIENNPPFVSALEVSGTNLFAGGFFTTAGGISATNIAQWNGSSWSTLGSGIDGNIAALAVSGTGLYVGGQFAAAGGVSANNIAQWNGSSWSPLGSGVGNWVWALVVSGNNLFAAGRSTIAQWNGSTWSSLGSGLNSGPPDALASDNAGNLYVGYVGGLITGVEGGTITEGTNGAICIAKALLTGPTPNQLLLANAGGGTNVITYLGTPGANYALDLTTNLAPPLSWIPQMTNTASIGNATTAGYLLFTNHSVLPRGFYRMRSVP